MIFTQFFVIFTHFFADPMKLKGLVVLYIFQELIHIFKNDFTKFQDKRYIFSDSWSFSGPRSNSRTFPGLCEPWVLLQTVTTQMKCSIMLHFTRTTLFVKVKKRSSIFRQNNTISFENYNLTPLYMYNGLSQVCCIKPEERVH